MSCFYLWLLHSTPVLLWCAGLQSQPWYKQHITFPTKENIISASLSTVGPSRQAKHRIQERIGFPGTSLLAEKIKDNTTHLEEIKQVWSVQFILKSLWWEGERGVIHSTKNTVVKLCGSDVLIAQYTWCSSSTWKSALGFLYKTDFKF